MRVAVIGGAGQMGSWFARYFSSRGLLKALSDIRREEAEAVAAATGAELAETNADAVRGVEAALVCVPMDRTPETIAEVAPHMRPGAILAEVTSIKGRTAETLRRAADHGIRPLSIHPLFGPSSETLRGRTIAVVPVVDGEAEAELAKSLFEEAEIVVVGLEEHDRAMGIVLSLTYLMNLAFAGVLSGEDLALLRRLAGTTFTVQLAVTESVVGGDPNLVAALLCENRHTKTYAGRLASRIEEATRLVETSPGGLMELCASLRRFFEADPDFSRASMRRLRAYEALRSAGGGSEPRTSDEEEREARAGGGRRTVRRRRRPPAP